MKKIIIFVLCALMMFSTTVSARSLSAVTANSYFLAEADEDNIIAMQGASTSIAPNEFSKLMTALVCMDKFYPGDFLTFKQDPLVFHNGYGNIAEYEPGIKLKVRHHLRNMLLLYSDASATELAIAYSGSVKAFTEEMNKKAKELGMKDTVFASPCGYDIGGVGKTTVNDLYILAKAVYENEDIMEILALDKFDLPTADGDKTFSSRNHLISRYTYSDYTYSAANGMIISRSDDTVSIIASAKKNNSDLIVIIANTPDDFSIYKDTINLFEYGFNEFYPRKICSEGDIVDQIYVADGTNPNVHLVADRTSTVLLPLGYTKDKITTKTTLPEKINAPLKKGDKIGTAEYYYDDKKVATVSLTVQEDVKHSYIALIYNSVLSKINGYLLLAIVLFLVFVIYSHNKSVKKKKQKRAKFEQLKKMK